MLPSLSQLSVGVLVSKDRQLEFEVHEPFNNDVMDRHITEYSLSTTYSVMEQLYNDLTTIGNTHSNMKVQIVNPAIDDLWMGRVYSAIEVTIDNDNTYNVDTAVVIELTVGFRQDKRMQTKLNLDYIEEAMSELEKERGKSANVNEWEATLEVLKSKNDGSPISRLWNEILKKSGGFEKMYPERPALPIAEWHHTKTPNDIPGLVAMAIGLTFEEHLSNLLRDLLYTPGQAGAQRVHENWRYNMIVDDAANRVEGNKKQKHSNCSR
jgi:hypothetical protein